MSEPITEAEATRLAETLLGFDLPGECAPGVVANMAMLADHAARIGDEDA